MSEHKDFEALHGKHGEMILAAVKYCLGRRMGWVEPCVKWLLLNFNKWPYDTRMLVARAVCAGIDNLNELEKNIPNDADIKLMRKEWESVCIKCEMGHSKYWGGSYE